MPAAIFKSYNIELEFALFGVWTKDIWYSEAGTANKKIQQFEL